MVVHELPFPVVWKDGVQAGYGGNQEWFLQVFQRTAGCASVTGANLAAYYASLVPAGRSLYSGETERFSKPEYLHVMEEMYRYMTPGPMGFPVAGRFVQKFLLFAREHGSVFQAHTLFHRRSCEERMNFLKEAIVKGNPVAFLILKHRAPEMKENNWHWVTITGWSKDADGEQVILSNCGEREVYPAELLFENHYGNVLRLVWFSMAD
ncbi:hypothetical protein [Faecalispora anaeroviscerum]|uniref:hypothetical protein n=1 Tax=Faecalispora anaeroviscerum TaxID=2991836 RepID=UPI0024BB3A51|nr:hypothetical protein [Faecalispora anaeroviscerum]